MLHFTGPLIKLCESFLKILEGFINFLKGLSQAFGVYP